MTASDTVAAAGVEFPTRSCEAIVDLPAAAILAHAITDEGRIYVTADEVVAKTNCAATAASPPRISLGSFARSDLTATSLPAHALGNVDGIGHTALHQRRKTLLPGLGAKPLFLLGLHSLLLLIHPAQLPAPLLADHLESVSILFAMPDVRHQPLNVLAETNFSVDLRLLVLHSSHTARVTQDCRLAGVCDLNRLLQFVVAVLLQHMCVVVEHR
mmetsp:Transcript_35070/g.76571  ORF Transcript_35070/g.76571 Transcript_35070/m.76571 type:complete len:214 (+) Transcript_35070:341-982(+)